MKRNLLRAALRSLLLLLAFAGLPACVIDGHGHVYSPFCFEPSHSHGHSHHHCR